MAVRRSKGSYLKGCPSRYVEQTEAFFKWRQSAPPV